MRTDIQWYPGHMTKTRREIEAQLKFVDLVAELLDARLPQSSRNPDIDSIAAGKPRLIILNKSDLADRKITIAWAEKFRAQGLGAVITDCKSGYGIDKIKPAAFSLLAEKRARDQAKGMSKTVRMMVCGIPNVGKSALINRLAGGKKARVEDRPGVTRARQWITVDNEFELMDTAGVLWPKFEDKDAAVRLALTGAIKDTVLDTAELALKMLEYLSQTEPETLKARYDIDLDGTPLELFERICKRRGMLIKGGEPDYDRCATMLLDELRAGKLGAVSFEKP
ncbi:MAG TPA: ribosome biogenesis GTPase YlqF [Oscillospiraceae bacterium]|nr:ribosome biogenesis GTPase YlqF [Oscillospiraceae bacterium]HPF55888.1 ribosome biogenesis GTPase YlqF [Clostridiales bacterium]HPK35013.1 ribosome biogenesis GTPase YlqF [Oscillospiraceae bacterium]HPR76262.1 ribosome biogenesis GTPase YlqF [Oscillospiraceae bacterium]